MKQKSSGSYLVRSSYRKGIFWNCVCTASSHISQIVLRLMKRNLPHTHDFLCFSNFWHYMTKIQLSHLDYSLCMTLEHLPLTVKNVENACKILMSIAATCRFRPNRLRYFFSNKNLHLVSSWLWSKLMQLPVPAFNVCWLSLLINRASCNFTYIGFESQGGLWTKKKSTWITNCAIFLVW